MPEILPKILHIPKLGAELESVPFTRDGRKIRVRSHTSPVQAGFPSPADDFAEHPISLDETYLTDAERSFLVRVKGDSMSPTLQPGDLLIVRAGDPIRAGAIIIASVNSNDFTVKRYHAERQTLTADNPAHASITLRPSDTLQILGVVKHVIRDL